jgi:Zn-dependent protease with chaperone function
VSAFLPVLAIVPVGLLALAVIWIPVGWLTDISYWWFVAAFAVGAVLLFLRPVQRIVLTWLLGTRPPTAAETARVETAWRSVLQANDLPHSRYLLTVLPSDELNAFACGGHLVVVTSYAIESLPRDELSGVLAHELSHHLGSHTVALTIGQWFSLPVLVLARIGFFLQNVAAAATDSFARESAALTAVGNLLKAALTGLSWVFLSGLIASNAIGNYVGGASEYDADRRAVGMGFGPPLASALRRFVGDEPPRRRGIRGRLAATHPPARTRVARIEAIGRAGSLRP